VGREPIDSARWRGRGGGDLQGGIWSPRATPALARGREDADASGPGAGGGGGDYGGGAAAVRRVRPREASAHGHRGAGLRRLREQVSFRSLRFAVKLAYLLLLPAVKSFRLWLWVGDDH
jgi:hypothetical protein